MSFFEYASYIEFKNVFTLKCPCSNTLTVKHAGKFILFILLICSIYLSVIIESCYKYAVLSN